MKKNVILTIKGVQSIPGMPSDTVEIATCGQLSKKNNSYWLSYEESALTGFAGYKTTLHIEDNRVTMHRTGKTESNLIIEKGMRHLCSYGTEFGLMNIGIMGSQIKNNLNESGGKVDFSYTMDIDTALASTQHITIDVTPDTADFGGKDNARSIQ